MTCAHARALMLTADPAELAAGTGSDLSLHIATCASCRARATLLLEAQAALANALDVPTRPTTANAVRSTLAIARRRREDARHRRVWIPAAAAAVIAGVMVLRSRVHPVPPPSQPTAPVTVPGINVTPPPGRSVAVWHTDDPNIVVIWFF